MKAAIVAAGTKYFAISFSLASCYCQHGSDEDFPTHYPEQALAVGIEHARAGIASGRNILDHSRKFCPNISWKQAGRHDGRARYAFWGSNDYHLARLWRNLAERHAAKLQADGEFVLINSKERQVHLFVRDFP